MGVAGGLISARMAFVAVLLWAGLALPSLIWRIGADAGLIRSGHERRFLLAAVFLCFIGPADLRSFLIEHGRDGFTLPQIELWGEEVRCARTSMIWVPHHITALTTCWTGASLLCCPRAKPERTGIFLVVAAGLSFSSTIGRGRWHWSSSRWAAYSSRAHPEESAQPGGTPPFVGSCVYRSVHAYLLPTKGGAP